MLQVRRRANNAGTFYNDRWRVKGNKDKPEVKASVRQLEARYKVKITATAPSERKRESAPLWRRYLQEVEDHATTAKFTASPFQTRITSLQGIIRQLRAENAPEAILRRLEGELRDTLNAPAHSTDYADVPVHHPQTIARAVQLGQGVSFDPKDGADDAFCTMLEAVMPSVKTTPKHATMTTEAEAFFQHHKAKDHKGKFQVRQALDVVTKVAGDVPPHELNVDHARAMHKIIEETTTWGQTTKSNISRTIREFLGIVASERNIVTYGFLNNKKLLRWKRPKGKKVQYTLDQVKTALQLATGEVRYALLCGLNFGMIAGDMRTMTDDMLKANNLVRSRQKLSYLDEPLTGSWFIWTETRQLMNQHGRCKKLAEKYNRFAREHQLPTHKALRKTTSQLMIDELKDKLASRLFKCRSVGGVDGHSYICDYTPAQVQHLEDALRKIGQLYSVKV